MKAMALGVGLLITAAACGDDTDPASSSTGTKTGTETGTDTGMLKSLPDCDETDFIDTTFSGPGFDPATGLLPPLLDEYLVSVTVIKIQDGEQDRFFELAGAVIADVQTREGLIGVSLGTSEICGTARTMTVWRSEADMFAFAASDAHAAAVAETTTVSEVGAVTHFAVPADQIPISWDEARTRTAEAPPF